MKKTVFLCVGGDARQTYTAQTLTKIGRTIKARTLSPSLISISSPKRRTFSYFLS